MFFTCQLFMNNKTWNILNWNIRGINSKDIWNAVAHKIEESACSVLCLQETKREDFDLNYLRNFCPKVLSNLPFVHPLEPLGKF